MSKVFHFRLTKPAFRFLQEQLMSFENIESFLYVIQVFFPCSTVHQDVVEKDKDKSAQMKWEDLIHQLLEGSWCIGESEWHYQKFELTLMHLEVCLVFITWLHPYWWYPAFKSSLEKNLALLNSSNNSSIAGIGNLCFTVDWFNIRYLMQNWQEPSCFFTSKAGAEKGLTLLRITPCCSISFTWFSISSFW